MTEELKIAKVVHFIKQLQNQSSKVFVSQKSYSLFDFVLFKNVF